MKKMFFIILIIVIFTPICFAGMPERYYQNKWCKQWNGVQEYVLQDKTRIDCVTKSYAVEFDFAKKWAESIGQSLHYAESTGKKPAIILIIENKSDWKYYNKIKKICKDHKIQLWYMLSPSYNN